MAKLQTLKAKHPEWKDQVEVLTVSIDDTLAASKSHIEKHKWTTTLNTWGGSGGFRSDPAKLFRISKVPTMYLLGQDGRVIQGGHPSDLDEKLSELLGDR
jgi:hypothetical protein